MNSQKTQKPGNVLSAAAFIAGTCIGVSYFSLPIVTGISGFFPALLMTMIVWIFGLSVGLLYAEATLTQPDGANLATISRNLLGKAWMVVFSIVLLFNMYTFITSYQFFATRFIVWFFFYALDMYCPAIVASLIVIVLVGGIIFLGMRVTCRLNFILVISLLISIILTLYYGSESILSERLTRQSWIFIFFSVPLLYGSFGYAPIMPSLCTYLKRDVKKIRLAVVLGTFVAAIFYLLWQGFMIGSLSRGAYWIMYEQGISISSSIALINQFPSMAYLLNFTVLFSVMTSMLGTATILMDFLSDAFNLPVKKRKGLNRLGITALIFLPVFVLALVAGYFILSLVQYFGAPIGEVLTNGIIPVWLVAQARYGLKLKSPQLLPGGRISLIALGIAIFMLIYLEGIQFIGY